MYFKIQGTYFKICALYFLPFQMSEAQELTKDFCFEVKGWFSRCCEKRANVAFFGRKHCRCVWCREACGARVSQAKKRKPGCCESGFRCM